MEHAVEHVQQTESVIDGIAGKHLTFKLAGENYGLEILKVQEIIGLMKITTMPKTPAYVKGVINLRGKVVPVIDLRIKFGLEETEHTEKTVIIVLQVESNDSAVIVGLLVDEVKEVVNIAFDMLQEPPQLTVNGEGAFISAMAKIDRKVVMLLDVGEILTATDLRFMTKK